MRALLARPSLQALRPNVAVVPVVLKMSGAETEFKGDVAEDDRRRCPAKLNSADASAAPYRRACQ
jgi:hypothetical protein